MRNLLLKLSFDGSGYHGFQVQKNALSVSEVFQKALHEVLGHTTDIKGCSRTDTGVHANMFCVSFFTTSAISPTSLLRGLTSKLPEDIGVYECIPVPSDFHARYSSVGKRYVYKVYNTFIRDPFMAGRVHYFYPALDTAAMRRAARDFCGTHDFSAFCSSGSKPGINPVRTIFSFDVKERDGLILFEVSGNGFLYNMVRIMVGTLLDVGRGKIPEDAVAGIITGRDRDFAGPTAPARGLYLDRVFYPTDILKE